MNHRILLACSFVCAAAAAAPAEKFTLAQLLSAPFASELSAAPKGGAVAWVLNQNGARNLWVAEATDYKGRQLTNYRDDDGREIAQTAWTPDGRSIVYVLGGDFDMFRETPNPASLPQGVEQDIWIVPISGGAPRQLAEGNQPAVSPQGDRIAFLRKGEVWTVGLEANAKPSQLFHARGKADSLRWSPDGSRIAFVSERTDHAFIGVYTFGTKSLQYLDPSVDSDSNPVWSSDGKQVAFLRLAASVTHVFGPRRTAQPWSIRLADMESGIGRQLFQATEGPGSAFHPMVAESQLLWGAGDRIVFPWERTGWLHLYSVSTQGGSPTPLNPNSEFEIEHVSLSADGNSVLFSSNQDDIDRRHLWRVAPSGKGLAPITAGEGIEWSPVQTSDGKAVAMLHSDARNPARAGIKLGHGEVRDLAPNAIPAAFPAAQLVAPQQVIFPAADGLPIHGQLFLPTGGGAAEKHPAVLFFHGGSRRQMLLGWHYREYYHNAYALNQYLASLGYVVLSVNYRSGIGYGLNFREALNYGPSGASEFNDVLGAGLYLRGRPDVNPARIGLWGGSYGGYLTALGLSRASDLFAAGVDFHGVHDWNNVIRNFESDYDPGKEASAARVAYDSSPMASIGTWRSPVLLIHGDDDRNVPFHESVMLAEALRKQGVQFEELIFPDEVHGFLTTRRWLQAYRAAADFLNQNLR